MCMEDLCRPLATISPNTHSVKETLSCTTEVDYLVILLDAQQRASRNIMTTQRVLCTTSGRTSAAGGAISEPAFSAYCECIFVQYDLIYFDVLAQKYMQIHT